MNILGISAFYHDSAACLLRDGEIVAAASEERFSRKKHDHGFPANAIRYALGEGKVTMADIDYVGFYDKPIVKFERILTTYVSTFPRSFPSFLKAIPMWLKEKLWVPNKIRKELDYDGEILFGEHHMSHAASSFLVSPFEEAAIMTLDGVGEWSTATQGVGQGRRITLINEIRFPHSLGLLYSAFTYFLGFKVNSAEYKVMGLAPYGEPKYYDTILRELIHVGEDGSFKMNMDYFAYDYGLTMTNGKFSSLFGIPVRESESKLEQIHKDLAASVQKVTEEIMLRQARDLSRRTGLTKLCLAGGVALNCVANGRVVRETPFKEIFIQPAAGDAGGAVGVAAYIYHCLLDQPRTRVWKHAYLGPAFPTQDVRAYLLKQGQPFREHGREELLQAVAGLIDKQNVVGWFQGRMEFGPRALGNRSILADARNPANKDTVNLKIKFRESFRPFAPTVLAERAHDYFDLDCDSPYMLLVAQVRPEKRHIPSVTHVDGSARIQTIRREENELYYDLVKEFENQTGCPVIINTSFNVRGEPIVCTPHDAYLCFMRTNMDYLVMDRFVLDKREMKPLRDDIDWQREFELD
ncbi:MAG TPA: carbamoyltransferase [Candidatus Polarisedimenticolia bacterium]|nr:carbamoyltransferase [Candidatus Polarisedimenticolia bacterium]